MKKIIFSIVIIVLLSTISAVYSQNETVQPYVFDEDRWMELLADPGYIHWSDLHFNVDDFAGEDTLVSGIAVKFLNKQELIAKYTFSTEEDIYFKVRAFGYQKPIPDHIKIGDTFETFGRVRGQECEPVFDNIPLCLTVILGTEFFEIPEE